MRLSHRPLAVTALAVTSMVIAACGGGGGRGGGSASPPASSGRVTGGGVTMTAPKGWATKVLATPPGLEVASGAKDFDALPPKGARLTAKVAPEAAPSADELITQLKQNPTPFVGPATSSETTVNSHPAFAIEWTETQAGVNVTTRMVVVSLADGRAWVFTLEAPQSTWATDVPTLEAALASVTLA